MNPFGVHPNLEPAIVLITVKVFPPMYLLAI